MTGMQRLIDFSTDASGAKEIDTAIRAAFDTLHKEAPRFKFALHIGDYAGLINLWR